MGKRKAKRKAPKPVRARLGKLESVFTCPFCHHENTVECKLDRTAMIGSLSCRVCEASFKTPIDNLCHPVDVFHLWTDARESAAEATAIQPDDSYTGEHE